MHVLQIIRAVDVAVYHFLNGFAGSRALDHFAGFEEGNMLFRGALFLAVYWYLWFAGGADQDRRRKAIVAIMVGTLFAVVIARIVADLAPYRIRPMYDVHLQHRPYASPISYYLVDWSSFPSDCATYFFALAFGLAHLSRRLALPAMLCTAGWICLPRLFLGEHWASDVAAGALIGIALVWASLKVEWIQSSFSTRLLALAEAKPGIFYAAAFLASFEMGTIFEDLRVVARAVFDIARAEHRAFVDLFAFMALSLLVISAYLTFLARKQRTLFRFARNT